MTEMNASAETTAASREVVRRMYAAAIAGDVATVLSLLDNAIVCHESPALPYGKVYRGHAGIKELFEPLARYLALEHIAVEHLIADGERVVAVIRVPVRSSGVDTLVSEHHLVRDGKVVEQRIFFFEPTLVR